jgi:hypothetical protein
MKAGRAIAVVALAFVLAGCHPHLFVLRIGVPQSQHRVTSCVRRHPGAPRDNSETSGWPNVCNYVRISPTITATETRAGRQAGGTVLVRTRCQW